MFCREEEMLENTYSSAVRLMLSETHRYLIQQLTGRNHVQSDQIKRFLTFLTMITKSHKQTLKYVLDKVCKDVRSVTGSNLKKIMIECGKSNVEDINIADSKKVFREIPTGEEWRVNMTKEIIDVENDKLQVNGFKSEELQEILNWICTSGPS